MFGFHGETKRKKNPFKVFPTYVLLIDEDIGHGSLASYPHQLLLNVLPFLQSVELVHLYILHVQIGQKLLDTNAKATRGL